jgi:hypothetical protein
MFASMWAVGGIVSLHCERNANRLSFVDKTLARNVRRCGRWRSSARQAVSGLRLGKAGGAYKLCRGAGSHRNPRAGPRSVPFHPSPLRGDESR